MKRFAIKLAIFLVALLSAQTAIAAVYPFPIPEDVLVFQEYLESGVEIIYFGDSTLWHPVGTQTTAEILQEMLPEETVGELSHAAYGMDIYLAYVQYIVSRGYEPELLIIPINMRSFSPEWDQRPGYQFVEEKRILQYGNTLVRMLGRPISVLGGFSTDITQEEYLLTEVYSGTVAVGQVQEFENALGSVPLEEQSEDQFIYYSEPVEDADQADLLTYYYMYQLTPEHRKVQAMLQIVDLLSDRPTEVLFYLTPINVELGDVYLPDAFAPQFARNTGLIVDLLAERDALLVDMSTDLQAYFFSDTEHLRQNGKQYVAQALAETIDPSATNVVQSEQPTESETVQGSAREGVQSTIPETTENIEQAASPSEEAEAVTAVETPDAASSPANPLLATAMARATSANAPAEDEPENEPADNASATPAASATPGATGSAVAEIEPTPANPLLATTLARSTEAAQPSATPLP